MRPLAAFLGVAAVLGAVDAHAKGATKSAGLTMGFYSGAQAERMVPPLAFGATFSTHSKLSKTFDLVNRFGLEIMTGGENFANSLGTYLGILGYYQFLGRANIGKGGLVPYVELGPQLGMYIVRLSSGTATNSTNQTSLKYGYTVGIGFNWGKGKGGKGIGLGVNYFNFLNSPSVFEFPAAAQSAQGIRVELRWTFGG